MMNQKKVLTIDDLWIRRSESFTLDSGTYLPITFVNVWGTVKGYQDFIDGISEAKNGRIVEIGRNHAVSNSMSFLMLPPPLFSQCSFNSNVKQFFGERPDYDQHCENMQFVVAADSDGYAELESNIRWLCVDGTEPWEEHVDYFPHENDKLPSFGVNVIFRGPATDLQTNSEIMTMFFGENQDEVFASPISFIKGSDTEISAKTTQKLIDSLSDYNQRLGNK